MLNKKVLFVVGQLCVAVCFGFREELLQGSLGNGLEFRLHALKKAPSREQGFQPLQLDEIEFDHATSGQTLEGQAEAPWTDKGETLEAWKASSKEAYDFMESQEVEPPSVGGRLLITKDNVTEFQMSMIYPYRTVGRFVLGSKYCSGVVLQSNLILTSRSCLGLDPQTNTLPTQFWNESYFLFGDVANSYHFKTYFRRAVWNKHDFAVLQTFQPIGNVTGWPAVRYTQKPYFSDKSHNVTYLGYQGSRKGAHYTVNYACKTEVMSNQHQSYVVHDCNGNEDPVLGAAILDGTWFECPPCIIEPCHCRDKTNVIPALVGITGHSQNEMLLGSVLQETVTKALSWPSPAEQTVVTATIAPTTSSEPTPVPNPPAQDSNVYVLLILVAIIVLIGLVYGFQFHQRRYLAPSLETGKGRKRQESVPEDLSVDSSSTNNSPPNSPRSDLLRANNVVIVT